MNTFANTFASALKFRTEQIYLEDLEAEFGFKLPPIYKAFIQNFEGVVGEIYQESNGEFATLTYFEYYKQNGENLEMEDFLSIEDTFRFANNNDLWTEHQVAPITSHSHGGCILVGFGLENSDKLFFENGNGLELLTHDIFAFIKNLKFTVDEYSSLDNLYRIWGENFWRIKG